MTHSVHTSVLLREAVDALQPGSGGIYVDGTLGGGGHTAALLEASAPAGKVISFDVDTAALQAARERFANEGERWQGIEENFRHLVKGLREHGIDRVDGILLDLGYSSDQLADASKGISFQADGPLDMRLGARSNDDALTAAEIVNTWTERDIEKLIREFGEERFSGRIAKAIVEARKRERFTTTTQLRDLIAAAVPSGYEKGRIHPATRTFQALRIVVNDELEALKNVLTEARQVLAPHGRIAVIAFHSLEDRVVKQAFKGPGYHALTKRPMTPTDEELSINPRSRSAKLRVAETDTDQNPFASKQKYVSSIRHDDDQTA